MKNGRKLTTVWKWLWPGMHVKRWLVLLLLGIAAIGLGLAYILRDIYQTWTFPAPVYYVTLQFIDRPWRALLFGSLGVTAVVVAILQLNRSLLAAFHLPIDEDIVDIIYRYRRQERGPKVVAIGGGTGLSTLLRGLKSYTNNITGIVTVADDGGSSGRLRRELGVLPPGDFRNCIAALANDESLMTQLFQYRFPKGAGLDGHSFGNLFIAAMAGITGNFERAILESGKVLAIRGRIIPSTLENVTLCAELKEVHQEQVLVRRVSGESSIPEQGRPIERVYLEPDGVRAYPEALRTLLEADLIVLGPGSLFTSLLPNLLIPEIVAAIRASNATKVYVCNVATQKGETDGFSVQDHIRALEDHVGAGLFSLVLVNSQEKPPDDYLNLELVSGNEEMPAAYRIRTAELVDEDNPWRHDSIKLARTLMELYVSEKGRNGFDGEAAGGED